MTASAQPRIGDHLREWRQRRRLSQLALAYEADISPRHLSFVETGRAQPSREMILHLAEQLEIPMRERNVLLVAGGYAPIFPERTLDDPKLRAHREAIGRVLDGHKPYPAFALDRRWCVVASNAALPRLYDGVAPALLEPPINVIRLSLHPEGLAPRIANLGEWRAHLLARLRGQVELTADPGLAALLAEVERFPGPRGRLASPAEGADPLVTLAIETAAGRLTFFTTTMVFGTPLEITLSELAIESFYPADAETIARVRRLEEPA